MKGISPLIASVFLIVIVVSLASIITTWMTTFVKSTQETVGERASETLDCSNAEITIDNVFLSPSEKTARIIVRNSGFVDGLVIQSAQIIDISGNSYSATNLPIENFNKGDIVSIEFAYHNIETCSDFLKAIVSTNCGGVSDTFESTPICL